MLKKEQILKIFKDWIIDQEQPEDIIRLDKGIPGTDEVCYLYFKRCASISHDGKSVDLWEFNGIDIQ